MNGGGQTLRGLSAALTLSAPMKGKTMSNDLEGRTAYTIWVCVNCIMHHANGGCGDCHNPDGHEGGEPLDRLDPRFSAMGMSCEEHSEDCEVFIQGEWPDSYQCNCETNTFSTSSCDGCGSDYHGERYAMTEWSN